MAPRPPPLPPAGHHADFIRRFTERESQNRITKRPKALTAAQHAALREQLKDVHFLKPDYAANTKVNVAGILRKWKRYCETAKLVGSWQEVINKADRAMTMDFLFHLCEAYKIKSWGTSWEYFRQYKQLCASATGRYMDRNDSREVLKWHDAVLVALFDLQPPNSREKGVADSGDLLALLTFNIAYDTDICPTERHRIQRAGCYIGLACTGARAAEFVDNERKKPKDGCWEELFGPKSIGASSDDDGKDEEMALDDDSRLLEELLSQETAGRGRPKALCYEDILLMVVRHPETGEDVLAMSIKFITTKEQTTSQSRKTIFFFTPTRRLIFCLISVIVSLAIADRAFHAPSLTSARRVFETKNLGPVKCTPLRWKEEWLKRPVFRRFNGPIVSEDEPLQYHKLRDDMGRQSLDSGSEKEMEPKDWRRGAANKANGKAPDAVRDQMMRHDPKWATFNSAYINENVQFHLQNAVLDEPTEDSLIGMVSHIGLMRDPRASKDMVPDEVWDDLEPDPEIVALEAEREQLKGGRYRIKGTENEQRIRELTKLIASKKAQRKKTFRKEYRKDYFYNRPTWDIERQAAGEEDEDEGYIEPVIDLRIPERAQLAEIHRNQPEDLSSAELLELRIQAAELQVALCHKREKVKRDRIRRTAPTDVIIKEESPRPDHFPLLMDRRQCPECIGDEGLSYEERTFTYCRPAVMYDHFDREHANQLRRAEQILCKHPICTREALKHKIMYLFKDAIQAMDLNQLLKGFIQFTDLIRSEDSIRSKTLTRTRNLIRLGDSVELQDLIQLPLKSLIRQEDLIRLFNSLIRLEDIIQFKHRIASEDLDRFEDMNQFRSLNHFKNHIARVHGIKLRHDRM
ncbi:FluG domain-containing protein [Diplogelasinospora grovesii]|uniref:FluG domain-containing protein n=1 Tax=Diplogelasinospora grovesii TaxID=303347 RepID=A0AAN6S595_9PEZI|nr:FluG domain-containing protein [Diplogelasinospora grovesii]